MHCLTRAHQRPEKAQVPERAQRAQRAMRAKRAVVLVALKIPALDIA